MPSSVWLALLATATCVDPVILAGQGRCQDVAGRESPAVETAPRSDVEDAVFRSLDGFTWRFLRARSHDSVPTGAVGWLPLEDLPQRREAGPDIEFTDPSLLATALATMLRGPEAGVSQDQAVLASRLYLAWSLPPSAATRIVEDRRASMRSRRHAVLATQKHWGTAAVRASLLTTLCDLALRSAGLWGTTSRDSLTDETRLSTEETELLELILRALLEGEVKQGAVPVHVEGMTPPGNPVLRITARYLEVGRKQR